MAKKVSSKSTKTEIFDAYQSLETEYQQLLSKASVPPPPIIELPKVSSESLPTTPKEKEVVKELPKKLSNVQAHMDTVIKGLAQLGEQFNTALSQLSTNLLIEAGRLKEVSNQVTLESQRLTSLYNLVIEENTLSMLLKNYTETAQQYEIQVKQKQEQLEKAWTEKNQVWQQEKEETTQKLHEQEQLEKKDQKREETEYHYNITINRELNKEKEEQQKKQQQRILEEMQKQHQQQWDEREKVIAQREKTFEELKAKVEAFEKDKEAAIKKAKGEGEGIARKQVSVQEDLQSKELEGQKRNYDLRIQSLEQTIQNQEARINNLSKQLDAALKQVQDLAVKAIEGASNINSYQALKEIAMEQAKAQTKMK